MPVLEPSIAENADANVGSLKNQTWVFFKLQVKTPLKTFPSISQYSSCIRE
jgi:hypothetical protein